MNPRHMGYAATAWSIRKVTNMMQSGGEFRGQVSACPRGIPCIRQGLVVEACRLVMSGQRVAALWMQTTNDGVVPEVSVPGPASNRPRGLADAGQLGRPSSLVEVNVAI